MNKQISQTAAIRFAALPAINAPFCDGTFAGITTNKDGQHFAVCQLPSRVTKVTWQAATDWAKGLNAELPSRTVAAMIVANVEDRPKSGWYWTCESVDGDTSYAWHCTFSNGHQYGTRKSYEGAAVAVRLIPLTA